MKQKSWWKKHKFLTIILILVIIVAFVGGAKLWLWVNLMLGNDIIITLSSDQENLFLLNGEQKEVDFKVSVTTNPFCEANCASKFKDISQNVLLDEEKFTIRTGMPYSKEYSVRPRSMGRGIELYSFTVSCSGVASTLCHTSGEETLRTFLLLVNHTLNEQEQAKEQELQQRLTALVAAINEAKLITATMDKLSLSLNPSLSMEDISLLREGITKDTAELEVLLPKVIPAWDSEDLISLEQQVEILEQKRTILQQKVFLYNSTFSDWQQQYNLLIWQQNLLVQQIKAINQWGLLDQQFILALNSTVPAFNAKQKIFLTKNNLTAKQEAYWELNNLILGLDNTLAKEVKAEVLEQQLSLDLDKDVLCAISGVCVAHPTIAERNMQSNFSLVAACAERDDFKLLLAQTKKSLGGLNNYSRSEMDIIDLELNSLRNQYIQTYLATSSEEISAILSDMIKTNVSIYTKQDAAAYVQELSAFQPAACAFVPLNLSFELNEISLIPVPENVTYVPTNFVLSEPSAQCCVHGKCNKCCDSVECNNDLKNYPIIFLHGHAVDKDVSTEFSLDAFTSLQQQLEKEGYVNGGVIVNYDPLNKESNFGLVPAPLTFRATYYYDVFATAGNYQLVQTKSENIDTYAIRLKDSVDWVKLKTGKPKVIIVAHSMGGLVARRYVQIFGGENTDKLILIGTPNQGIVGNVMELCPLVGEKLECNNMQEDSLFLNKLNRDPAPIPVYTIVGSGCDMDDKDGDGVVLADKSKLGWADNTLIKGSCSGSQLLHTEMLKYPEVYSIITNILLGK